MKLEYKNEKVLNETDHMNDDRKPHIREHYTTLRDCIDKNREVIYRYILFSKRMDLLSNELAEDLSFKNKRLFDKAVDEAMRKALDIHESEIIGNNEKEKKKEENLVDDDELTMPSEIEIEPDNMLEPEHVTEMKPKSVVETESSSEKSESSSESNENKTKEVESEITTEKEPEDKQMEEESSSSEVFSGLHVTEKDYDESRDVMHDSSSSLSEGFLENVRRTISPSV